MCGAALRTGHFRKRKWLRWRKWFEAQSTDKKSFILFVIYFKFSRIFCNSKFCIIIFSETYWWCMYYKKSEKIVWSWKNSENLDKLTWNFKNYFETCWIKKIFGIPNRKSVITINFWALNVRRIIIKRIFDQIGPKFTHESKIFSVHRLYRVVESEKKNIGII